MPVSFDKVHDYMLSVTPRRDATLMAMEAHARRHGFPIIGPLVGRLLFQLATAISAKRVFELGSGYGYSGYWFSQALGERGRIVMTDGNPGNRLLAEKYFKKGRVRTKREFRVGDALEIIGDYDGPFDIILNDIDKHAYPQTIDLVAPRLRKGGLFITDNTIWSGRVYNRTRDKNTLGVIEFNRRMYADRRFFTTILPLRDGLTIGIRR
ncbi:MAG: O-methyltransferase [candidate division Zixibacteria bacterium]|nr:O-methyltransferase [candidate division Zixibacteria bacterium]